jgi:hypothetical protein
VRSGKPRSKGRQATPRGRSYPLLSNTAENCGAAPRVLAGGFCVTCFQRQLGSTWYFNNGAQLRIAVRPPRPRRGSSGVVLLRQRRLPYHTQWREKDHKSISCVANVLLRVSLVENTKPRHHIMILPTPKPGGLYPAWNGTLINFVSLEFRAFPSRPSPCGCHETSPRTKPPRNLKKHALPLMYGNQNVASPGANARRGKLHFVEEARAVRIFWGLHATSASTCSVSRSPALALSNPHGGRPR